MNSRPSNDLAITELVAEFLSELAKSGYAPNSIRLRRNIIMRFARWCEVNGIERIGRVHVGVLQRFAQDLGSGGPLRKTTWNHIMTHLRAFFRWLVHSGYVDVNPVDELVRKLFPKEVVVIDVDPSSFEGVIEAYLEHLRPLRRSKGYMSSTRTRLRRFCAWCAEHGHTQPGDLDVAAVEAYAAVAASWGVSNNRASESGAQVRRSAAIYTLRGFYTWLVGTNRAFDNPAKGVDLKTPRRVRLALSEAEMEQLLHALDIKDPRALRLRAALEVLYSTGMRLGELLDLELRDIDRARGLVMIRKGKGAKSRVVPIGTRALEWLDRYLEEARPAMAAYEPNGLDVGRVFLNRFGRPLSRTTIQKALKKLGSRLGLRLPLSPHILRHTTATVMLEHGADLRAIQELLGHEDLNSTQVYTHTNIRALTDVHRRTHPAARRRRRS